MPATLRVSSQTVREGTSVFFDAFPVENKLYPWKIVGNVTADDFVGNGLTGNSGALKNKFYLGVTLRPDFVAEQSESFKLVVYNPGTTAAQLAAGTATVYAESPLVQIEDLVRTASVAVSSQSVQEGTALSVTLTTTNVPDKTALVWRVIGLTSDLNANDFVVKQLSGSVGVAKGKAVVSLTINPDFVDENMDNEKFKVVFYQPGVTLAQAQAGVAEWASSPIISVIDVAQSISIQPLSSTTFSEGSTISFQIKANNIPDKGVVVWRIVGDVTSADFVDKTLEGMIGFIKGSATVIKVLTRDLVDETAETFKLLIYRPGVTLAQAKAGATPWVESQLITANDVSLSVPIIETTSTRSAVEGYSLSFSIKPINVPDRTPLFYKIEGNISANDFSDNSLTGQVYVSQNSANVIKPLISDLIDEPGENAKLILYKPGATLKQVQTGSAAPWAESVLVSVLDSTPLQTPVVETTSTKSATEGYSLTASIKTVGLPNYTMLYYQITGSVSEADFFDKKLIGQVSINKNAGYIITALVKDGISEPGETAKVLIYRPGTTLAQITSGSAIPWAESEVITINDA